MNLEGVDIFQAETISPRSRGALLGFSDALKIF
jgi:hypothetical protein